MSTVLVLPHNPQIVFHLSYEMEIVQNHIAAGDKVVVLHCDSSVGGCRHNMVPTKFECENCLFRRVRAMRLLQGGTVEEFFMKDFLSTEALVQTEQLLDEIKTFAQAVEFSFEGAELGMGALSGYTSIRRDIRGEDKDAVQAIKSCLRGALSGFVGLRTFLSIHTYFDKIYIFNGRLELSRAFAIASRLMFKGLPENLISVEAGSGAEKYHLYKNFSLFDRSAQLETFESFWEGELNLGLKRAQAEQWFRDRRNAVPREFVSFVSSQHSGLVPDGLDCHKRNIAVFMSSEDEVQTLGGDWKNQLYITQFTGLLRILDDCLSRCPDTFFWIRMHPNSAGCKDKETRELRSLRYANACVIPPESNVSSYSLLDRCDAVLTFGSTVGIEAAFWGKPSILCGPAFYEQLGSCYVAASHDEVIDLCGSVTECCPVDGALKYGFYYGTFGTPFQYWETEGYFLGGKFNGRSFLTRAGKGVPTFLNRVARVFGSQSYVCRFVGFLLNLGVETRIKIKRVLGLKVVDSWWGCGN